MEVDKGLVEEIQQTREKLVLLYDAKGMGFLDASLYLASCEMDKLIVKYTKQAMDT